MTLNRGFLVDFNLKGNAQKQNKKNALSALHHNILLLELKEKAEEFVRTYKNAAEVETTVPTSVFR